MNLDQMYPSKWLKAGDLQGQTVPVVIMRVVMEDVGDEAGKPVAYFQGRDKGLVLNKTNAMSIGLVHGQDTDAWTGKTIELFPAVVMFQGQNVPCIRVRPVAAAYAQAFQPAPQPGQGAYGAPERPAPQGPGEQAAAQAVQAPLTSPAADGQTAPITDKTVLDDKIKF
jgi:hypothetical protein